MPVNVEDSEQFTMAEQTSADAEPEDTAAKPGEEATPGAAESAELIRRYLRRQNSLVARIDKRVLKLLERAIAS